MTSRQTLAAHGTADERGHMIGGNRTADEREHAIDGNRIADELKQTVFGELRRLGAGRTGCGLATVLAGDDYRAGAYERRLARIAAELGLRYRCVRLPAAVAEARMLDELELLNRDPEISGILVLRPLPPQVSEVTVFRKLSPLKDIESVHPENAGLLALGTPRYIPSTAASVFHVLDAWLDDQGEDRTAFYHRSLIVVVGRSNNVGKPVVSLAYDRQAAVASVDEWASDSGLLGWHTRRADVLVVAAGVPDLIRIEHVKAGAIVLDVGINPRRDPESGSVHMVGDVAFDEVAPWARAVTPVPGGVGPVTDLWLLRNTIAAARNAAVPAR